MRIRRVLSYCLCVLLLAAAPVSRAESAKTQLPSRQTFSLAYQRLQEAIQSGRAVRFDARIEPKAIQGYTESAESALIAMLSAMNVSGELALDDGGGTWTAGIGVGGESVAAFGQKKQGDSEELMIGGEWFGAEHAAAESIAELLGLGSAGASLLDMDFQGIRNGEIPLVSMLGDQLESFWLLASPYGTENGNLRVPSGPTSHALTFTIDTQALQKILPEWIGGFSHSGLSLGGSDEVFQTIADRLSQINENATLSTPMKLNMTFGEGDVLRTARLTGTVKEDNRKTPVAFNYTYNQSKTRITRKYTFSYAPKVGDTVSITATALTSSNNKTSGAQEFSFSANGTYGGKPYKIRFESALVNRFAASDGGTLSERITGTTTLSLKYAGKTVVDISVKRAGDATSAKGKPDIRATETLSVAMKNAEGTLFQGDVFITLEALDAPAPALAEAGAGTDEETFFSEPSPPETHVEKAITDAKQKLIAALPEDAIRALLNAYK